METGIHPTAESRDAQHNRKRRALYVVSVVVLVTAVGVAWNLTQRKSGSTNDNKTATSAPSALTPVATSASGEGANELDSLEVVLTADDLKKAQLKTEKISVRAVPTTRRLPGIVKPNAYREVHVMPVAGGIVTKILVQLGDRVRRGQALAQIFSNELADAESQYLVFQAELEAEHKRLVRTQDLAKLGAASQQELEEVQANHAAHSSHVLAAREKLKLLGATDAQIQQLSTSQEVNSNVSVPAPIDGVVLERSANLGQVANMSQELFTIADLSHVWILGSLNESDFDAVRVGSLAQITAAAYPDHLYRGRVAYIDPAVEPKTRTAQARIEIDNSNNLLRIDMYVDIDFRTGTMSLPALPATAVQAIGGKQVVFVPSPAEEGKFFERTVRLGPESGGYYPVLEGLKAGDTVVTGGSFILKAEAVRQHPER